MPLSRPDDSSIAEGWNLTSLKHIAAINPRHSKGLDDSQQVTFVPMAALSEDSPEFNFTEERMLAVVRKGFTHFAEGDVLFAKITPSMENGKGAIAKNLTNGLGCGTTELHVFRPSQAILAEYLYRFLSQRSVRSEAAEHFTGSAGQLRVPETFLSELEIPLPPFPEQQRIVATVNALLHQLRTTRERLARIPLILKRFRQAIFSVAFGGQLTSSWRENSTSLNAADDLAAIRREALPPENERVFEIPDVWQWTTLGECFEVGVGGTPSRKVDAYWNGHIPWVSSGEVRFTRIASTRETITDEGLANSNTKLNPRGTVLLGMIGEGKTRGQAAILDIDACNNQNAAAIRVSETSVPPEFVFYWLWSQYESTRERGEGNSQPALNKERVKAIPMPFPPLAEQHEIVRRVDALFTLADAVERRVSAATVRADKLTQAILAKAFRGELVPTEAELARIEGRQYESADQMLVRVAATKTEPVKATLKPRVIHKTAEHIIDIRQDVSMRTLNKTSVMAAVAKMKTAEFTFDDLRKAFPGDYEGLKQTVFDLLQEPNSELTQRFDETTEQMKLVRRQK